MKVLILGTSNSIKLNGYVSGLRQAIPDIEIVNWSVGASPGTQFAFYMQEKFSAYDFVFFDSVANDENQESRLLGIDLRQLYFEMFSTIASQSRLIVLGFSNKRFHNNISEMSNIHRHAALRVGVPFIGVKEFIDSSGLDPVYEDESHPSSKISHNFGVHLGSLLENPKKSIASSYATRFWHLSEFPSLPHSEFQTSLMTSKLFDLEAGKQLTLGGAQPTLGIYLDTIASHGSFTVAAHQEHTFDLNFVPSNKQRPFLLVFFAFPGGTCINTIKANENSFIRFKGMACWAGLNDPKKTAPPQTNFQQQMEAGRRARRAGDRQGALAAFEAAAACNPKQVNVQFEIAAVSREIGRLDEAETALRRVLSVEQNHFAALVELGHVQRCRGDRPAALASFKAASGGDPRQLGVKVEVATELRQLERLDEAEAVLREILTDEPKHVGALVGLGHVFRRRGDHLASLASFEAASAANPGQTGVKMEVAAELRELGRIDEAERLLRSALANEPKHFRALVELGHVLRRRGDRPAALASFEAASAADPHQAGVKMEIAAELRELGRIDEAEALLRSALAREPKHFRALVELGHLLRRRGDRSAALASFEAASAAAPGHAGATIEVATELREVGRVAEAEALLRRVLTAESNNRHALAALGSLLIEPFRLSEAEALFNEVVKLAPTNPAGSMGLGFVARRRGDRRGALRHFRSALAIDPNHTGATLETAAELRDQSNFNDAHNLIDALIGKQPTLIQAWMQRGYVYRHQGRHESALETFESVLQKFPDHTQALVEMAFEQRALARPRETERLLRKALDQDPRHLGALLQLAEYTLLSEDYETCLVICQRAMNAYPTKMAPYLLASRAANELGQRDEAADFLRQAREKLGANPEIKAVQVAQSRQARDWPSAYRLLRETADDTETYFCLWSQLMQLLITTGDYVAAEGAFNEAPVNTATEGSLASLFKGQIAEAQWRLEEAAAHYKDAVAFNPGHGWAHAEAARISLKLLDLDASRTHVSRMTELDASARLLRAQSTNASQTHIGQLIDEFSLDTGLLQELKQIRKLPIEHQLPPLRNIVRNNADHTPSAIMLFIALRQAGLLKDQLDADGADVRPIPRRIIQYWDEPEPPEDIRALMNSWIELHPDFEYVRFDDARARQFLKENHTSDISRAYTRAREPAQRADIFRLAYLSAKGGFYVDADDRSLAPIYSFVSSAAHFATYQEDYGTLANNFLGAKINHPAIKLALARGAEAINRGDRDLLWLSTGPALLTRAFSQLIADPGPDFPDVLGTSVIFDLGVVQRHVGLHCAAQYKKTEKHWGRSSFGAVTKSAQETGRLQIRDQQSAKTSV